MFMKKLSHGSTSFLVVATLLLFVTPGVTFSGDSTKSGSTTSLPTAAPGKIYYTGINVDMDIIPKPACPGTQLPEIFVAPVRVQAGTGTTSKNMSAFVANATDLGNGTWLVNVKVVDVYGTASTSTSKMLVITRCCDTSGC